MKKSSRKLLTVIERVSFVVYIITCILLSVFILGLIMLNVEHQYLNIDESKDLMDKVLHEIYLLFSNNDETEINKSLDRIRDFINLTQENGSGSYPEDFSYKGFIRDDRSVIYSKAPIDGGINEYFNFGNYSDLSTRSASGVQMAKGLEYDGLVNNTDRVVTNNNLDPTLNASGTEWFKQYRADKNLSDNVRNSLTLRRNLRNL